MDTELCPKRDRDDEDDELTIPRAAMNKMIKELLPNIRVANDARELILNCCTEFIHLISSESNDICNQQQKKTISAEHVLAALDKLGYGDFRKEAEEVVLCCVVLDSLLIRSLVFSGSDRSEGERGQAAETEHQAGEPGNTRGGITETAAGTLR